MKKLPLLLVVVFWSWTVLAGPIIELGNGHKYDLQQKLGAGAFGVVYRAESLPDHNIVAIKLFPDAENYDDEMKSSISQMPKDGAGRYVIKRLDNGRVKNPVVVAGNVAGASGSGSGANKDEHTPVGAIVMEVVDSTLHDRAVADYQVSMRNGDSLQLDYAEAARRYKNVGRLAYQMIDVWAAMASRRLIHGDIKPGNLGLLNGDLRVLDTGGVVKGILGNESKKYLPSTSGFESPELQMWNDGSLPASQKLTSYNDLFAFAQSLTSVLCAGCTVEDLRRSILREYDSASGHADRDEVFAPLFFALDVIEAGARKDAEARYRALLEGPLKTYIRLLEPPRKPKSQHFANFQPSVAKAMPDLLEGYRAAMPYKASVLRAKVAAPLDIPEFGVTLLSAPASSDSSAILVGTSNPSFVFHGSSSSAKPHGFLRRMCQAGWKAIGEFLRGQRP